MRTREYIERQIRQAIRNPANISVFAKRIDDKFKKQLKLSIIMKYDKKSHDIYKVRDIFYKWVSELSGYSLEEIHDGDIRNHDLAFYRNFIVIALVDAFDIPMDKVHLHVPSLRGTYRTRYNRWSDKIEDILAMPKSHKIRYSFIKAFNEKWELFCKTGKA